MTVAGANERAFRIEAALEVGLFTFQVRHKDNKTASIANWLPGCHASPKQAQSKSAS